MESQTFIELCEKRANVGYFLTQIQREFGSEYAVAIAEDSSGIRNDIHNTACIT